MHYETTKFGYTVTDLDYTNSKDADEIRRLIGEGRFVVIKNKEHVLPKSLVTFYNLLGDVVKQNESVVADCVEGYGELVKAGKGKLFAGKEDGELEWHCAGMNRVGGEDIVAMYMRKAAAEGGITHYSDAQTAYADLDEETKQLVNGLNSKYLTYTEDQATSTLHSNIFNDKQTMMEFIDIDGEKSFHKQATRKKLVTEHPINGKLGLYFPWAVIRGFAGLPSEGSKRLYFYLKEFTLQEKYVYHHNWDDYDLVLSDQKHSLHRRDAYDGSERELWRSGIWVK